MNHLRYYSVVESLIGGLAIKDQVEDGLERAVRTEDRCHVLDIVELHLMLEDCPCDDEKSADHPWIVVHLSSTEYRL